MGCSESKQLNYQPILSANSETKDIFTKYYKPIPIGSLRTSEEFLHDGHNILNNARILEQFTKACKNINSCEDRIQFVDIGKKRLYKKIKNNFQEHAKIYNISLEKCIILWQDKFIKYYPDYGIFFINKLKNELDIQEWNTIIWDDYSK